ncbi:hypothetical protein BU17DRAFT_63697 [Hysterangium stoloniferum]|nr:hypothetical protein BU17DRAFT_63697 [Hysterangium stoloniferum]
MYEPWWLIIIKNYDVTEFVVESSYMAAMVVMVYDYEICVATTVVTGKIPLSFRELHRFGTTSDYHNSDPGLVLRFDEKYLVHPVPYMKVGLDLFSGVPGCKLGGPATTVTAQRFWFGMLPSLINETILCSLMILKAIQNHRDEYRVPILSGMIQDSIIYFASIFAALIVACTIYYPRNNVEVEVAIVRLCISDGQILIASTDYQLIKVEDKSPLILPMDEPHVFHTTIWR